MNILIAITLAAMLVSKPPTDKLLPPPSGCGAMVINTLSVMLPEYPSEPTQVRVWSNSPCVALIAQSAKCQQQPDGTFLCGGYEGGHVLFLTSAACSLLGESERGVGVSTDTGYEVQVAASVAGCKYAHMPVLVK